MASVKLQETRTVDRPIEEVFDYVADFGNIEEWDPGVVTSRRRGDGVGPGTEFEVEVRFGSGTAPMVYEITEFERPSKVVLVGTSDRLVAVDEITFTDEDGRTRIDYTADLQFRGLFSLVAPFIRGSLRKVGEKALDGLARALA
jgi:dehydrogenase/reductase SDR family member 12